MAAREKTPEEIKAADEAAQEAAKAQEALDRAQAEKDQADAEASRAEFEAAAARAEQAAQRDQAEQAAQRDQAARAEAVKQIEMSAERLQMPTGVLISSYQPVIVPAEIPTSVAPNGTVTAHVGGEMPDQAEQK